ncbi:MULTISPECIES: ABC transporter substrate-binding protein [unclassified Microbacterium]|uniref:ABC transporter substrate-binding protein n=1 Tax=unclassified Microbacterium TaxID=2609290 RepID=UPI00097EAA7A|nr:ABC transporter substrate-binding protein [Microbacterium sp. JB110]RCS57240.1 ABC transporter substrate-binding protein [Microbacterium sp. JB110]SJM59085.1 Oligopeptide ABC transporter, periplasmic oligopeptide-binding protein OppA (TC 3.A.1.5.1) [Frigoribacterium sp. JB110]
MKHSTAVPAAAAAVVLALTLTACGGAEPDGDGEVVSGGTFRHAIFPEVGSIIPMSATQPQEIQIITYAYESLIYTDQEGQQVPWLADSWELADDGTSVTFELKDGVTFHDGTPFDAEVAAANINYHSDPDNATTLADVLPAGLEASGEDSTLTVTADVADPFLANVIGDIVMVGDAGLQDPSSLEGASNGTGLYELTDVEADLYVFDARDDYTWGPDGLTSDTEGLPDALEISVVADASTRANLLLSGEVNAAAVEGPDQERIDSAGYEFAGTINPIGQMLFNEREDRPTHDPRVREALILGFDHGDASEVVSNGRPVDLTSWITDAPFTCFNEEPVWERPAADAGRAAELLDEAGWTEGADGVREKGGEPLEIDFIYDAGSTAHTSAAELLAQDWEELGITTELIAMDGAGWSEYLYETFDYDTGWIQIGVGSPVTQNLFYGGASPEDGGLNFMGVDDDEYNALAEQAGSAADADEACEYWSEAEKLIVEKFHTLLLTGTIRPTYMSGAEFEFTDYLQPVTIRMTE